VGTSPKYLVCDKGVQFWNAGFKRWCKRKTIKPRFGAIGKHGSIAVIERFIRSLKEEYLNRLLIPLRMDAMRQEIACYAHWYNEHRPHQSLNGATPLEIYEGATPANQQPRCEPRRQWPSDAPCAAPYAPPKPEQGKHLTLVIRFADRQKNCRSSNFAKRHNLPRIVFRKLCTFQRAILKADALRIRFEF